MASQGKRLTKKDVKQIFIEGKRVHSPHITLVYTTGASSKKPLYSVVISKKVSPKAVERNRLKRQIRAILRTYTEDASISAGIFVGKPPLKTLPYKCIKEEVIKLLQKPQ